MKTLLRNIFLIAPGNKHNNALKDILIEDGIIKKIADSNSISDNVDEIISGNEYYVSSGWFDLHANFAEPGHEEKETLATGANAAVKGGFTGVLLMPSTTPPVTNRSVVENIKAKSKNLPAEIFIAGTLSADHAGKDLSEMYEMFSGGVKVFTDDKRPVYDSGLMTRALMYAKNFGGKIFSFPEDKYLAGKSQVNESEQTAASGMKGIPPVAEELMIARDIFLAEYTHSHLHFSTISTAGAVKLIREAKNRGIKVTADVAAINLLLDDSEINSFDSVYKVKPPLRTKKDIEELILGLKDGTIDAICSDHIPHEEESKIKEFELAEFGAAGIETAFAVARTATKNHLSIVELITKFTTNPRHIAGLNPGFIEEGKKANLTIFQPHEKITVTKDFLRSKGKNNPFLERELIGKVVKTIFSK